MYFQDHNPPHFHAEYQGMKAEYDIKTLEVLAGNLPNRAHVLWYWNGHLFIGIGI
jgi:hypothetical protein